MNSLKHYAIWAAVVIFAVAIFVASITTSIAMPIALFLLAAGLFFFWGWDSIRTFDIWIIDEWVRTRKASFSIRDWHTPNQAVHIFCDPSTVNARTQVALKMNSIMMNMIKSPSRNIAAFTETGRSNILDQKEFESATGNARGRHSDYEAAQRAHSQYNLALSLELIRQLVDGKLMAKGLPSLEGVMRSERIIPTSRWRVMNLDISKAEASGGGLNYVGIVIGKKLDH